MDKTITIDGRDITFRATARTPRLYRMLTGRDMIIDMTKLRKSFVEAKKEKDKKEKKEDNSGTFGGLSTSDLIIFEDSAYVMARHANPDMKEQTADEWLDTFNMFDIFDILPELMDLWNLNNATTSTPKKK